MEDWKLREALEAEIAASNLRIAEETYAADTLESMREVTRQRHRELTTLQGFGEAQ